MGGKDILNRKLYMLQDIDTKKVDEFLIVGIIKNFNYSMALLIAIATVSFQAVKAALANPVKRLKSNH